MGSLMGSNSENGDGDKHQMDIAIVGGGIIGVMVALGLLHRGISVTIYERADDWHEIGAGFSFTSLARECMQRLDPNILESLRRIRQVNPHPQYRYWDGFNPATKEAAEAPEALLFSVSAAPLDYWACLRSHFLHAMVAHLPDGVVRFGKRLESYVDDESSHRVVLRFADGSRAEADAVIGCDGIHSRTRQLLLGENNPASYPSYTHKVAYRALIPIEGAIEALGEDKGNNQCIHLGPDAHIPSYPLIQGPKTLYNIVIFLHDPNPWPHGSKMTAPASRDEVSKVFQNWTPSVRDLFSKLPETLTKWAIFDMADNPAHTYAHSRVAIAGDAAHASSPFHGAGAAMGVEDALAIATALHTASIYRRDYISLSSAITMALKTFSDVRLERSQWLVQSSRDMGEIYEWRYPGIGRDAGKCMDEQERRSRKIWDFDVDGMVEVVRGRVLGALEV